MLTRENFDKFIKELSGPKPDEPDVIWVGKHWGIERIRQVVKSGATIMCDKATYDWIQANL